MRACITALLILLSLNISVQATAQDSSALTSGGQAGNVSLHGSVQAELLPVEEDYQLALEIVDERQLRLYWQITDSYYLYKKRFSFKLEDPQGEVELAAEFPKGLVREDEYFGISEVYYTSADIILNLARASGPATLTIASQGCADAGLCYPPQRQKFNVDFENGTIGAIAKPARDSGRTTNNNKTTTSQSQPLWLMLLMAFIGGSILNLMPCVFPVLSLKVFSFATGSEHTRHVHGWVYAAGVVASFVLVALLLITLQQAGAAVGWGFQLQSPRFVALLAYLFFAMGLGLSGLVEIGAGLMGAGSQLADRGGYSGSFFTGVLATVVASPCTAPFMGTALGFAVTQSAPIALAIFAALGAGMAAPMLALSHSNTLREKMPKPGPWMETFKQLLAFPLYATAIWLLWVSGRQTSVTAMSLLLCGMLILALGLWLWRYRGWGKVLGVAAVLSALAIIPSAALDREQNQPSENDTALSAQQELEQLLAAGKPVFVNVTADWCITCIANERGSLSSDAVQTAMQRGNITYLSMDWTNYDADIARFLAQHGRNGVPLYLVYSGRAGESPQILPQLLTPGVVVDALESI